MMTSANSPPPPPPLPPPANLFLSPTPSPPPPPPQRRSFNEAIPASARSSVVRPSSDVPWALGRVSCQSLPPASRLFPSSVGSPLFPPHNSNVTWNNNLGRDGTQAIFCSASVLGTSNQDTTFKTRNQLDLQTFMHYLPLVSFVCNV